MSGEPTNKTKTETEDSTAPATTEDGSPGFLPIPEPASGRMTLEEVKRDHPEFDFQLTTKEVPGEEPDLHTDLVIRIPKKDKPAPAPEAKAPEVPSDHSRQVVSSSSPKSEDGKYSGAPWSAPGSHPNVATDAHFAELLTGDSFGDLLKHPPLEALAKYSDNPKETVMGVVTQAYLTQALQRPLAQGELEPVQNALAQALWGDSKTTNVAFATRLGEELKTKVEDHAAHSVTRRAEEEIDRKNPLPAVPGNGGPNQSAMPTARPSVVQATPGVQPEANSPVSQQTPSPAPPALAASDSPTAGGTKPTSPGDAQAVASPTQAPQSISSIEPDIRSKPPNGSSVSSSLPAAKIPATPQPPAVRPGVGAHGRSTVPFQPDPAQMQANQERQKARAQQLHDYYANVFTDRTAFLQATDTPEVREAIRLHRDPETVRRRAALKSFLATRYMARNPDDRATERLRERYNQEQGQPGLSFDQSYDMVTKGFLKEVHTARARKELVPQVTNDTVHDFLTGGNTSDLQTVRRYLQARPEATAHVDVPKLMQEVRQTRAAQEALLHKFPEQFTSIVQGLWHQPGQAEPDEGQLSSVAEKTLDMPIEDVAALVELAGAYARQQAPEAFSTQAGYALRRGAAAIFVPFIRDGEQLENARRIAYLRQLKQQREKGVPATLSGGDNPYSEYDHLTPAGIDSTIAYYERQNQIIDRTRLLRGLANEVMDPLRPTAAEGTWAATAQGFGLRAFEAAPSLALGFAPGGLLLTTVTAVTQNYDYYKAHNKDLAPETALRMAVTSAVFELGLQRIKMAGAATKLKGTETALEKLRARAMAVGKMGTKQAAQAEAVTLSRSAVIEAFHDLGADVGADYDRTKEAERFIGSTPEVLGGLLLPWLAASGGMAFRKAFPRLSEADGTRTLESLGLPRDKAREIVRETDPEKQRALEAAAWASISDEQHQKTIADYAAQLAYERSPEAMAARPKLETVTESKPDGQLETKYEVRDAEGNVLWPADTKANAEAALNAADAELLFSKNKAKGPVRENWDQVRVGDQWNSVKGLYRKLRSDAVASKLKAHGHEEYIDQALAFIKANPVITDWTGRKVVLPNGDANGPYGDRVKNRAYHLVGSRISRDSHIRELRVDKAEFLASVPETIRNGDVKVRHNGEILYFKRYGPEVHMVTTGQEGAVLDQQVFDSGLVTQYPIELNSKKFDGAVVDSIRRPVATQDQLQASRALTPATAATDSTEMAPSPVQRENSSIESPTRRRQP